MAQVDLTKILKFMEKIFSMEIFSMNTIIRE